jgi:hypothetical protein
MSNRKQWGGSVPWYLDARERETFEAQVRNTGVDATAALTSEGYVVRFKVSVNHYDPRRIVVIFTGSDEPVVFADGPTESKHRWSTGALCMWDPEDPASRRWIRQYGGELLVELIRTHLFREAYWRETDHWPGKEAPHGPRPEPRSKTR